jgi:hypothetical protein
VHAPLLLSLGRAGTQQGPQCPDSAGDVVCSELLGGVDVG